MTTIIGSLEEISHLYDAIFCDVWGVVHNGLRASLSANSALRQFRQTGKPVVLLTNSPRLSGAVIAQSRALGVPDDSYDTIVTSGDAARQALANGDFGARIFHLGPDSAISFFEGGAGTDSTVELVGLSAAEGIVCTGLVDDETETPEDYRELLTTASRRQIRMLCANPDIVVDRGSHRVYCAGALAAFYEELGGEVFMYGKPHRWIYDLARQQVDGEGEQRILCIGDGILTDVKGAESQSLDCLFVSGGLSAGETGTGSQPDPDLLEHFLASSGVSPGFAIGHLR